MHAQSDYPEDDWLALSGLQHFAFCRRQWALIHIEQQWEDNYLTTAGSLEHDRAHDYSESETRGSLLIMRDLRVFSRRLGITGACDVVEFRQSEAGVPLHGRSGTWLPYPWNTNMVRPSRRMRIAFNFARRPCVWRRCWPVRFQKALCSTNRPDTGSGSVLTNLCAIESSR